MREPRREEFARREPEYSFESVPFTEIDGMNDGQGILCTRPDNGAMPFLLVTSSLRAHWRWEKDVSLPQLIMDIKASQILIKPDF
jgi:hypothetical protein